jgi:COP9 signalosome complex subunit 7
MAPTGLEPPIPPAAKEVTSIGSNAIEQFLILSKSAKGLAAVELIKQVLEHPQIHVFAELLEQPFVEELEKNQEYEPYVRLLKLFAFGVYEDYAKNHTTLPKLSDAMLAKLRSLTIVTMATKTKRIPYSQMMADLQITNLRDLENLVIELIYANIVDGKMDQSKSWLEIESTIARDITPNELDAITSVLTNWCDNCDNVLANIEQQITLANVMKVDHFTRKAEHEAAIAKVKSTVKTSMPDIEDGDSGPPSSQSREFSNTLEKMKRSLPRTSRPSRASSSKSGFWKSSN